MTSQDLPSSTGAAVAIVEDCDEDYRALARIFGPEGATLRFATGNEAIAAFGADHPSLRAVTVLIVDLGLPDISGIDVIRTVRGMRHGNHPAIFALTASQRASDIVAASAAGIDDYFVKPRSVAGLRGVAARIADTADLALDETSISDTSDEPV